MGIQYLILSTIYIYMLIILLTSLHLLLTMKGPSDMVLLGCISAFLYSASLSWISLDNRISAITGCSNYRGMDLLGSLAMAPCSAGIIAPLTGLFFALKSSQISAMVTHFTPGFLLMYSINLRRRLSLKLLPNYLLCRKRDSPFQHENYVWMPADIRVNGHWKAEVVILSVEVIKMIPPQILHIPGIDPAM